MKGDFTPYSKIEMHRSFFFFNLSKVFLKYPQAPNLTSTYSVRKEKDFNIYIVFKLTNYDFALQGWVIKGPN